MLDDANNSTMEEGGRGGSPGWDLLLSLGMVPVQLALLNQA